MMINITLNTENLVVGYDNKPVVSDVNINVEKGEILTLIGPNGSGKSTVLKSICGQLKKISGDIILDGKSLNVLSLSEIAENVAQVFTEDKVVEPVTCYDVVAMGRYPYTGFLGTLKQSDVKIIDEIMELTRVVEYKESIFTKLSDGQKQRVLLARALCQMPKVLILDEPTTFLDIRYRLEFLSLLYKMAREKSITIVMSLHELDMARQISDHILCIKDGRIDKYGAPNEIFSNGYINDLFNIKIGTYNEELFEAVLSKEI